MAGNNEYKFNCSICNKEFKQKQHLNRHERTVHGDISHKCEVCNVSFNRLSNLMRHMNTHKKRPLNDDSSYINPKRPCTSQETTQLSDHTSQCNWCCQHKHLINPGLVTLYNNRPNEAEKSVKMVQQASI